MTAWTPQPGPQTAAILTGGIVDELLFGGARGGGKSDFLCGDYAQDVGKGYGAAWRGLLVRRSYPELLQIINRAKSIYGGWFGSVDDNKTAHVLTLPDAATLEYRYFKRDEDAEALQGNQYTWIGWDELGNSASMAGWNVLKATLRSPEGVPCLRMRASANPGGRGHQAIKQYFGIGQYPHGGKLIRDEKSGMTRMFIKSRVTDNKILMENDPKYVGKLQGLGSEALVRAWLEGDWDAIIGAFFDCWRSEALVIRPFALQTHWIRFRSFDWGYASPFSVHWWVAVSEDTWHPDGFLIPKGSLVAFREWYGADPLTGMGLRLRDEDIAAGILNREREDPPVRNGTERVNYSVADPSIWNAKPNGLAGPTTAETMARAGVRFRPADNGRIAGWQQMRSRMIGLMGRPLIYFFDTCDAAIRTIPTLQHSELDPEDLDTEAEDHAADDVRYACMSRPWMGAMPVMPEAMKGLDGLTMERLWAEAAKERRRARRAR